MGAALGESKKKNVEKKFVSFAEWEIIPADGNSHSIRREVSLDVTLEQFKSNLKKLNINILPKLIEIRIYSLQTSEIIVASCKTREMEMFIRPAILNALADATRLNDVWLPGFSDLSLYLKVTLERLSK